MKLRHLLPILTVMVALATPVSAAPSRPGPAPGVIKADSHLSLSSVATAWMPQPRSNMAVVEWDDRVYCFGGNGLDGPTATAWEFNPYTRHSRELPPMAEARFAHAAAVCGRRILVFGGMRGATTLDTIEAFDLDRRTWSAAGKLPVPRARFGLAVLDGKIWLAGGTDGSARSADVYAYDPKTSTWEKQTPLPEARDRLALVAMDDALYALGGETPEGKGSAVVWRYTQATKQWTKIASLTRARKNLAAARLGGQLIVAGGWNIVDDEKQFPAMIEVYDPRTKDWIPHGMLESPRDGVRAATWRGRVFLFGGFNGDAMSSVEEVQWQTQRSAWAADEPLKIHLATWSEAADPPKPETERPLGFTTAASADITNIRLDSLRKLGFPVPQRPDESALTFYLKFFEYPTLLTQEASVRRAAAPFLLSGTSGWRTVAVLVKSPTGVVVKKGVIDKTGTVFDVQHPFPPLRVPTEAVDGVMPQELFDRTIVFASLYVVPSNGGVAAVGPEITTLLGHAYRPITGPDPKVTYFLDDNELDQAGDAPTVTVIRVEKAPTVFDNWHDLPMPQDPSHMFLGSLLLMYRDDYHATKAVADARDLTTPIRSTVFEIGSVTRGK